MKNNEKPLDPTEIGFGTPFKTIREKLMFRPGELILLAGAAGSGKSQLAGQLMLEAAQGGFHSCIANLEISHDFYAHRLARQCAGIRGRFTQNELSHTVEWMTPRIQICDRFHAKSLSQIEKAFHSARHSINARVLLIDSFAYLDVENDQASQRTLGQGLGDLAKATNSIVFLVQHVAKQGDSPEEAGNIPGSNVMCDLADTVLFTWRNRKKEYELEQLQLQGIDPDPDQAMRPDGAISCVKQRNSDSEPILPIWFDRKSFQFLDSAQADPVRYCLDSRRVVRAV